MLSVISESIPAGRSDHQLGRTGEKSGGRFEKRTSSSVIPLLFRQPTVDDVLDARNRNGRLGDVGSEDDLASIRFRPFEGFRLLGSGEFGVERGDDDLVCVLVGLGEIGEVGLDLTGERFDFFLTCNA